MTALAYRCRACDSEVAAEPFAADEMLLDTHESFDYVECPKCGSLQLAAVPHDLARYYPDTYRHGVARASGIGRWLRAQRGAYVRGVRWNVLGAVLLRVNRPAWVEWMTRTGARTDSRILDVGYGDGALLGTLSAAGYRDLTGIDPFAPPIVDVAGVRTFRRTLDDEPGTYDVVMLHHSLEHVADPAETLRHVRRVLAPAGRVLVRMPVAAATAGERTASIGSGSSRRDTSSSPASKACAGSPSAAASRSTPPSSTRRDAAMP